MRGQRRRYVFGLARNERLVGAIADELAAVELESLAQGGPARRFADFAWRTLRSWSRTRRVVAKAEHLPKGANPPKGGAHGLAPAGPAIARHASAGDADSRRRAC